MFENTGLTPTLHNGTIALYRNLGLIPIKGKDSRSKVLHQSFIAGLQGDERDVVNKQQEIEH